jgi:hypothetical protein
MEEWRDVEGWEGKYQVSNFGRVRNLDQLLSQFYNNGRYLAVYLSLRGKKKIEYVHRLVAKAFVDGYAAVLTVNHKDGNRINNRDSNLEWVSVQRNIEHAFETGLRTSTGEANPKSKLTATAASEIRRLKKAGVRTKDLVAKFGVGPIAIQRIAAGTTWKEC